MRAKGRGCKGDGAGFEEEHHKFHSRPVEVKVLVIKRDVSQTFGYSKQEVEFGSCGGPEGK